MPAVAKKSETIKGFGPPIISSHVKSHANDPFVLKKVEKARQTLLKVGLPSNKKIK